jgi:hypothetical protein
MGRKNRLENGKRLPWIESDPRKASVFEWALSGCG